MGNQFLVVDRLDIALLDGVVDIGKAAQLLDRVMREVAASLFGAGGEMQADEVRRRSDRSPPDSLAAACCS
jgi:hypothetical protein